MWHTLKVWNEIYGWWSIDLCIRQMTSLMNLCIRILTVLSLKVDDDVYPMRWRTNEKSGGPWNKATGLCNAEAVFCTNSNWIPKQRFDVNFRFEMLKTATEMWKITDPHYGNGHGWGKATYFHQVFGSLRLCARANEVTGYVCFEAASRYPGPGSATGQPLVEHEASGYVYLDHSSRIIAPPLSTQTCHFPWS